MTDTDDPNDRRTERGSPAGESRTRPRTDPVGRRCRSRRRGLTTAPEDTGSQRSRTDNRSRESVDAASETGTNRADEAAATAADREQSIGEERAGGRPGRTGDTRSRLAPSRRGLETGLTRLVRAADAVSYRWVQASFGFVFFYFGLQKWPAIRGASPVRPPVKAFVEAVGFGGWIPLPPEHGLLLIGLFEVTLGLLWFATIAEESRSGTSRVFVLAALGTVAHQTVTFLPLVVVPGVAFRQTELVLPALGALPLPVALDWLSAFIFKNLLFLGAFFYCVGEWADRYGPRGAADPQ